MCYYLIDDYSFKMVALLFRSVFFKCRTTSRGLLKFGKSTHKSFRIHWTLQVQNQLSESQNPEFQQTAVVGWSSFFCLNFSFFCKYRFFIFNFSNFFYQHLQFKYAIFASDYWCWAKTNWEKTKICNQNYATVNCHFRFRLLKLIKI